MLTEGSTLVRLCSLLKPNQEYIMTLRLGLEWFLNPDHVPFLVGLEKNWFKEAGIDLELVEPEEHLDAIDAIEEGTLDIAVTEPIHLVEDAAKGHGIVGFMRFLHTNGGVMYFADSGIERPRDMVGKRIQYPGAPGPGGPAIVKTMIEADGGQARLGDFERVNNSFYHTDALIEDKADLATLVFYNFEVVEARHKGHDARFFALKDWGVPDFCQLILITSPDIYASRREELTAFSRVVSRGIDFLHQNPAEAQEIYMRRSGSDPEDTLISGIFDATTSCFTFDFSMAKDYYSRLEDWMHRNELISTRVDLDAIWRNDIALGQHAGH